MRMTVAEVMTTKVVSVTATTPFKAIAEALISCGISAVPVLDDEDHVVGIAARMTGRVNGVADVVDNLTWKYDDSTWEAK